MYEVLFISVFQLRRVRCGYHGEVVVVAGFAQGQLGLLLRRHAHQHVVEDVVVPLLRGLQNGTRATVRNQNDRLGSELRCD